MVEPVLAARAPRARTGPDVLLVDDDPDILEVMKLTLEHRGYSAVTAVGGAAGLECLRAGTVPGVILLDMMMPDVDGWAFRSEQVHDPALRDIPVVVMTADQHAEDKAREISAAGFVRKPLSSDALVKAVEQFRHA